MNDNDTLIGSIEPDITQRLGARAHEMAHGADTSSAVRAGLTIASVPVMLAALTRDLNAQSAAVTSVLNFALMLEIFESEFYKAVLGTTSSAAHKAAFAGVHAKVSGLPGGTAALQQI